MHVDATTIVSTLATVLVGGCAHYLRSIERSLKRLERRDFNQDLWILDHEQRLNTLKPRRSA